jgi:hypothetical protein
LGKEIINKNEFTIFFQGHEKTNEKSQNDIVDLVITWIGREPLGIATGSSPDGKRMTINFPNLTTGKNTNANADEHHQTSETEKRSYVAAMFRICSVSSSLSLRSNRRMSHPTLPAAVLSFTSIDIWMAILLAVWLFGYSYSYCYCQRDCQDLHSASHNHRKNSGTINTLHKVKG